MSARHPLALLAAATAVGCLFPVNESGQFQVTMPTDVLVVVVGDTMHLAASVMRQGKEAPGATVAFSTSDDGVVTVDSTGLLRGVGVGLADVTARARRYEDAMPAVRQVRVLRGVQIDTVLTQAGEGHRVKWGELVSVVGRGLDPSALGPVFVDAYPATIESFAAAPATDPDGVDTLRLWIPALAPDTSNLFVSRRSGSAALWQLRVTQSDVFEPNETRLHAFSGVDSALRFPGLALEVVPTASSPVTCWSVWSASQGECWTDGYSVTLAPGQHDLSMIFKFPSVLQGTPVAIEVANGDPSDPARWLIAQNWSLCDDERGAFPFFSPTDHEFRALGDSFLIALKGIDSKTINFSLTLFGVEVSATPAPTGSPTTTPYEMRIIPAYVSALPPDIAEENDFCHGAYDLGYPSDALDLNFDHGGDLDWYHLTVPGTVGGGATGNDVNESEVNDLLAEADTLTLGDRALGGIDAAGDVDSWAFHADSGQTLDLEVRAERDGDSALDSWLMVFFGGELIAVNDNISVTTYDSRITLKAQATGWYTFQIRDARGSGGPAFPYRVTVRSLGPEFQSFTAFVTDRTGGLDPVVQLWDDNRLTEGSINLRLAGDASVNDILGPGEYLLLIYDRNGKAGDYRLQTSAQSISTVAPAGVRAAGARP